VADIPNPDDADSDEADGLESEPAAEGQPVASDEDPSDDSWTIEHQLRRQLRLLHDAITAHIDSGDFVPSVELEAALLAAKSEADWC
jgi:hypothetical protein